VEILPAEGKREGTANVTARQNRGGIVRDPKLPLAQGLDRYKLRPKRTTFPRRMTEMIRTCLWQVILNLLLSSVLLNESQLFQPMGGRAARDRAVDRTRREREIPAQNGWYNPSIRGLRHRVVDVKVDLLRGGCLSWLGNVRGRRCQNSFNCEWSQSRSVPISGRVRVRIRNFEF